MAQHQRQLSLPPSALGRTERPPSREREDGPSTTGNSSGRERLGSGPERRRTPLAAVKPSHPLLAEIERLVASCEAYEREIRSSQNTINHQLAEWSGKFDTLHDIDTKAEKLAFDIRQSVDSTHEEHDDRIAAYLRDGQKIVDKARVSMELWNEEDDGSYTTSGDKWEQWQADIKLAKRDMKSDAERLERLISEKEKRERRKRAGLWFCVSIALLVFCTIWFLLWAFEWRPACRPRLRLVALGVLCWPITRRRYTVLWCWSLPHPWCLAVCLDVADAWIWLSAVMAALESRDEKAESRARACRAAATATATIEEKPEPDRRRWRDTLKTNWQKSPHRLADLGNLKFIG